jgi:hypothetical protein
MNFKSITFDDYDLNFSVNGGKLTRESKRIISNLQERGGLAGKVNWLKRG